MGNGARSIARYGGYRYAPFEARPAALRRGQVQMATEQFGPARSVGNPAQAIGSPDADPVVDHQDPEFVVHRDVHLRPAGMSVTSGVAGLVGHDAVVAAYNAMSDNLGGEMTGGVLQPMVPARGVETIVGGLQDPSFGPLVVFGLGGITVEVLGDHVTRLAPLTDADAREMVTGLRGSALLTGYRGQPAVDVDGLVEVLHRVSRLVEELPEVAELDCNPVIATPDGPLVVDARIRIDPGAAHLVDDTRHLR